MDNGTGPIVVRKAAEVHKNKIDYTVKVLEKLLNSCQERLDGYIQELEDLEAVANSPELTIDPYTKNKYIALQVKVSKEEHMKFYLKQEIDKLEKTSLDIAISLAEAQEKSNQ